MFRGGKHVEVAKGTIALSAATISLVGSSQKTVAETAVLDDSVIIVIPTNTAARTLGLVAVVSKIGRAHV